MTVAPDRVTAEAGDHWWWYAVYLVLAVAGIVVQARAAREVTRTLRETWDAGGIGASAPAHR